MNIVNRYYKNLIHDQRGATAVEYGLIGVLISVVIIASLSALGLSTDNLYSLTFGVIEDNISETTN